uniref:Uncharacterized protein n=1 Tax=Kalanchoe fedtschenkoi TaxID=63787 RepID=A0A7N0RGQ2_KALFE
MGTTRVKSPRFGEAQHKGQEWRVALQGLDAGPHLLHLPHMLDGVRTPRSLPLSSSISLMSRVRQLLLTLSSELPLLLVARGESETLMVLPRVGGPPPDPDRTLYIEDAGMFKLRTMCRIAISRDFLDRVLPKPELSGDEADFPERLGEFLSSCGGASFLILTTRSTILVPIKMGFTLSLTLEPLERRPLDGEQDCLFGLPAEPGSIDDERPLDRGLPLDADNGLSGADVLKFVPDDLVREIPEFTDLVKKQDDLDREPDILFILGDGDGRRVGVDALDAGTEARPVGVEDLATGLDKGVVDLVDPADLDVAGIVGLFEDKLAREVGVEGREALEVAANVGRPVGVADLDDVNVARPVGVAGLDPGPPDDEGLRIPVLDFNFGFIEVHNLVCGAQNMFIF